MTFKKPIVYILPHNDDEIFVIPKLTSDLKAGHEILIFYLMKSELRFNESLKFLSKLGLNNKNIISVGNELDIYDGELHNHMEEIYSLLLKHLESTKVSALVCTAYEGGHNDHDAASLISRALAVKFQTDIFEFYLYNGYGTRGKMYNVSYPVNFKKILNLAYSFNDLKLVAISPFIYISQFNTMLGLWPFLMLKIILRIPLRINIIQNEYLDKLVYSEIPLYERWGRITQVEFNNFKEKFLINKIL